MTTSLGAALLLRLSGPGRVAIARLIGLCSVVLSLGWGLLLLTRLETLTGPGDQIRYFEQAAQLFPYIDNYYGPNYYVALRVVHAATGTGWFESAKIVAFISACAFLTLGHLMFRRVLPLHAAWLATALLALNPEFISASYAPLTILYGAVWVVGAVLLITRLPVERRLTWLFAGMVFGLAALSRNQSIGFLLGAVGGMLFLSATWRSRGQATALLVIGAAIPLVAWRATLLAVQGYVPRSHNFMHLTLSLGEFQSFNDAYALVAKYGSTWGVLSADPLNIMRILRFSVVQLARFPLVEAPQLLGPSVFWLVPGVLVAFLRRETYAPWTGAFAVGLVLTGIAARGWTLYYVPILPLLVYGVAVGIQSFDRERKPLSTTLAWGVVLVGALGWSALRVPNTFEAVNWPEWAVAREYLNRRAEPTMVVSSTALSLQYGARFRFVDYDDVMNGRVEPDISAILSDRRITHLVVSERHGVEDYSAFASMLADSGNAIPMGLVRDTLIVSPRRLAILRVVR